MSSKPGVPHLFVRASLFAFLLEAPYAWLLWIDYPMTGGHRLSWMKIWPSLPGMPALFVARAWLSSDTAEVVAMSVLAALLYVTLVLLAGRGRAWFWTLAALTTCYGIWMGLATYALFRM